MVGRAVILDDIRSVYPTLGLALYAITPGEPVVLEVHAPDGSVFTFRGATAAHVLAQAFPDAFAPATPEPVAEEPPAGNVFD